MKAMTRELAAGDLQRQQGAEAGGRQGRDDRQRVREALVQHAEHDVDGEQRGQDQERLLADRLGERLGVAGEVGADDVRQVQLGDRLAHRGGCGFQRIVRLEAVGDGHRGKLALVIDHERRERALELRHSRTAEPGRRRCPARRCA